MNDELFYPGEKTFVNNFPGPVSPQTPLCGSAPRSTAGGRVLGSTEPRPPARFSSLSNT